MKRFQLTLQRKFLLSIVLIILPTLGLIFIWAGIQQERQTMGQIVNQARVLVRQIILTRQWVSDCGGVMVPREAEGARETMSFYQDIMETPRGSFQRFTPSMVTKKLSQYSLKQDLYRFRLASINPLNPENRPDSFERNALRRFAREGLAETYRIESENGTKYFQYMVPLFVDKTCLECHTEQGFAKGAIGGGLSVLLPIDHVQAALHKDYLKLAIAGLGLISLLSFTLFFLVRKLVIKPLGELKATTAKISSGDLSARVDLATGDELEELGRAFNGMAVELSQSQDILKEKIKQATHELARANEELQSLDKLKSDFLANMSHELRSPLTVLRGGVDYLNRTALAPESRSYLDIIDKNLSRLINLVSDLFDFTRIEAKKVEWSFQQENLAGLIQEVLEIIGPLAAAKSISLDYDHGREVYAEIDLERIQQVLVNLIENAIKFSDPGTRIAVSLEERDGFVQVAVKDQGVGIREENLTVIFEKFHTLPSSRGRNKGGTGLGLAICKGIVQGHGGRIWAESTPGEGSTFFFTVPARHS